jgi:hypothetical protein
MKQKRTKLKFNDVKVFVESKGCKLLSTEYVKLKDELEIEFKCGHSNYVRFDVFKDSVTFLCRKCQKRKIGDYFKNKECDMINRLSSMNLKFIEFPYGYLNEKSLVTYECEYGHIVTVQFETISRKKKCSTCAFEKQYSDRRGSGHPNWNGGTSYLSPLIKGNMTEWRKDSIIYSGKRCVISGGNYNVVHHLYGFNMILDEALENIKMQKKNNVSEYTEDDIIEIINECKRLHSIYPLGVCLRQDIHILFHQIYGKKNNTPEQFYEFVYRIKNGEITIE